MGNNVGIAIFIFQALLALFAFFVTAPMTLNAIAFSACRSALRRR